MHAWLRSITAWGVTSVWALLNKHTLAWATSLLVMEDKCLSRTVMISMRAKGKRPQGRLYFSWSDTVKAQAGLVCLLIPVQHTLVQ